MNARDLETARYPFIAIAPSSTLAWSGRTRQGLIYRANRTTWHLNWVQTNDLYLSELIEIEVFDQLTVCKQMTDV